MHLIEELKNFEEIHFFEETVKNGSIAEHLLGLLNADGYKGKYTIHAIDNKFIPAADVSSALKANRLDYDSMLRCFNG